MEKVITVNNSGKIFLVKIHPETIENKPGLAVMVFSGSENSECLMKHFLDFSGHPDAERESNMQKFIDHTDELFAKGWVDGYLDGVK